MPDESAVRIQAHRQNIRRYKALLATPLTALERDFIDRRIAEEDTQIQRLSAGARKPRTADLVPGLMGSLDARATDVRRPIAADSAG